MKTKLFAVVPLVAIIGLAACSSGQPVVNKAPTVVGVKDVSCIVNTRVDFLDGVAALDREDGDITPNMEIEVSPKVSVENGYATFTEVGEYTVTYTIVDSQGRKGQKYAYVDVKDRETYRSFGMPNGFYTEVAGSGKIKECGMKNGAFLLSTEGGEIAEDVRLIRDYTVQANVPYTYKYVFSSDQAGVVKAWANGKLVAEMMAQEGENNFNLTYTGKAEEGEAEADVKVALGFGNLQQANLHIKSVDLEYPQEEGKQVDLTQNFSFAGRVERRFDNDNGNLPLVGNAWASEDGTQACMEVTSACNDMWRGGMHIGTDIEMKNGVTYTVSFTIEKTDAEKDCEIALQRGQWNDHEADRYKVWYQGENGHHEETFTVNSTNAGKLWLYVQSGNAVNEVKLSNLKVVEHLGAFGHEEIVLKDFSEYHADGFDSTLTSVGGKLTYQIANFARNDGDQKITSPGFFINGSGANYVVSFRAKATANIDLVFVVNVQDGWDPTLTWQHFYLSEEETVYTFFLNGNGANRNFTLLWQFGSSNNQAYHDVTIEISDIRVCLRNVELDG